MGLKLLHWLTNSKFLHLILLLQKYTLCGSRLGRNIKNEVGAQRAATSAFSSQSESESEVAQRVGLFVTPWTRAYQASPSMGFSRQEHWSGLPFPSPKDLPDPGIEPRSPALQADALPPEPPGKSSDVAKQPVSWTSAKGIRTVVTVALLLLLLFSNLSKKRIGFRNLQRGHIHRKIKEVKQSTVIEVFT